MIAEDITLVGEYIHYNTNHELWWTEYSKGEELAKTIRKKNALPLKDIYQKMYKDGIHSISLHFEGGHDEGGFDGDFVYKDKDDKIIQIADLNKYKPDGWINIHKPLQYENKENKIVQVFELVTTDYSDINLTEDWLQSKWYEFGFLNEWGSFAFEGNVYGDVVVQTKDGSYKIEANETYESYENKEYDGRMFDD